MLEGANLSFKWFKELFPVATDGAVFLSPNAKKTSLGKWFGGVHFHPEDMAMERKYWGHGEGLFCCVATTCQLIFLSYRIN